MADYLPKAEQLDTMNTHLAELNEHLQKREDFTTAMAKLDSATKKAESLKDGFSPTATVTQTSTGADVSITDKNGTTNATITNGTDANVTKENVVSALGYTPLESAPVTSVNGKTGTVVVDTEESVCEGIVLPNMEYPEYAINTIILKQFLGLTTSDIYIDPIAKLKSIVTNTIVWYSDIYTAMADVNAGVVTNGSSTEISTGVKVMKIGDKEYYDANLPANMFIVQLLSDVTLTERLQITTECLLDFNGHTITYTYSTSNNVPIFLGNATAPIKFAVMFYGVKPGSAFKMFGNADVTDAKYVIGIGSYCGYLSIIGGTYSLESDTTQMYGAVIEGYMLNRSGEGGKYAAVKDATTLELCMATITAKSFCSTAGNALAAVSTRAVSNVIIDRCAIDLNYNGIATTAAVYSDTAPDDFDGGPIDNVISIKESTITAYSKPNSSIQSAYGVLPAEAYVVVRKSTIHAANCGINSGGRGCFVSDSVLEGGEHGGIYAGRVYSAYAKIVDHKYFEDHTSILTGGSKASYIQNTTLRKLDGTGSPHNNLYSCYVRGGKVYFNNVTFDSYNGAYNRPSIASHDYSPTEVYLSNCSMNGIRVDANCKAVLGAGIPDAIRAASVSGTIVNKPTEIYSAVISREIGGMSNRLHEGILKNKESIKALGTAEGISGALGYTPLSSADGSVQNAHLADSAVTTDKLAEAERMTSANITNALGYEPEEKSGEWELIEEITLTEDTAEIVRTAEPDGTAYNLKGVWVYVSGRASKTVGYLYLNWQSEYVCTFKVNTNEGSESYSSFARVEIQGAALRILYGTEAGFLGSVGTRLTSNFSTYTGGKDAIVQIKITNQGTFYTGSKIKIYGIRA